VFADVVNRQALKRRLTPEDTAAAVAFLVTDGAAALTGQELCVDGALILRCPRPAPAKSSRRAGSSVLTNGRSRFE